MPRSRSLVPSAASPALSDLPDDVLVHCLSSLSQAERCEWLVTAIAAVAVRRQTRICVSALHPQAAHPMRLPLRLPLPCLQAH